MARSWFPQPADLHDDIRVCRTAEMLQIDRDLVVGKLGRLWSWIVRQSSDDHVEQVTERIVDDVVGFVGFGEALLESGLLRLSPRGLVSPDFDSHLGPAATAKLGDAARRAFTRRQAEASCEDACRDNCPDKRPRAAPSSAKAAKSKMELLEENCPSSKQAGREEPAPSAQRGPAAPLTPGQVHICSLLRGFLIAGRPVFEMSAARTIARHPNATVDQLAWVLERFQSEYPRGHIKNPAGYLRSMIVNESPPGAWTEQRRRAQLEALARQSPAPQEITDHSPLHPQSHIRADGSG